MPPCSRGSWRHPAGPVLVVALALLLAAPLAGARAAAATTGGATPATVALASQTPWVTGPSGSELALRVASALPVERLGLNVVLYSRLGSRDALRETFGGTEPSSEYPLDSPATIPLASLDHGGLVRLHLPVTTGSTPATSRPSAPTLALDCATGGVCPGVYPLELVVIDRTDGAPLASLTTYLVYAPPTAGSLPLDVALVLPVGTHPALSPDGSVSLPRSRLDQLAELLATLARATTAPVSLAVHGQLVDALANGDGAARGVLSNLTGLLAAGRDQLLPATYAATATDTLAQTGLTGELARQLATDRQAVASHLHTPLADGPYVVTDQLDPAGLRALRSDGIASLVLPPSSLSTPVSPVATPTAPLLLAAPGAGSPGGSPGGSPRSSPGGSRSPSAAPTASTEGVLSDPGLAATFDGGGGSDPVLAAERFLAEASSVYFDDPFATEPRGVVVVGSPAAPTRFLSRVLAGLAGSPVLRPVTLSHLLATVPAGANGTAATGSLADGRPDGRAVAAIRRSVGAARRVLDTLRSVVPTDTALAGRLERAILVGEGAALDRHQHAAYEGAPAAALHRIAGALALSESRTTLTSRSGRIPVTATSSVGYPVHVLLQLRSSDLTFANGQSVLELPLALAGPAVQRDIRVSTHTSGSSRLELSLLSPRNEAVLVSVEVTIRSTAISGAAVALSAGAVLVLLIWWIRSSRRRRRTRPANGAAPGTGPGTGPGGGPGSGSGATDLAAAARS